MFSSRFKVLPLMIFVAFLAFSMRLVDVFTGFSTLSGTARAQHEVHGEEPPPMDEGHDDDHGGLVFQDESEEEGEPETVIHDIEGDPVDWQDAGDSDLDFTAVRMELFQDLSKRRKEIEEREKKFKTREALLQATEQEIDRKYQELSQLRSEIERLLEQQSEEEQARIASLVKIYENMKPKDAARIFDTLDLDVLLAVMGKMSERRLSPILANMNPERARTVTIMLAQQKKLPDLPGSN